MNGNRNQDGPPFEKLKVFGPKDQEELRTFFETWMNTDNNQRPSTNRNILKLLFSVVSSMKKQQKENGTC
jgi:hypothetical protein